MTDAAALAGRVEGERPSYQLWVDAWCAVWREETASDERWREFDRYLTSGAYRDAAAMLMPEGADIDMILFGDDCVIVTLAAGLHFVAHSEVPSGPHAEARARCAAALRAHAGAR